MDIIQNTVNTYAGFREFRPMTLREKIRHRALDFVALKASNLLIENNSVTFLVFHYLFEDQILNFRKLVEVLSESFQFISVSDGVEKVRTGNISGRYICFTCDDGFSNFANAASVLEEFDATGCVFVCPRFVEIGNMRDLAFYNKDRLGGPPVSFLKWDDIVNLKKRGHEIGNHTFSHKNLGSLSLTEVQEEIESATEILKYEMGDCEHFACPYGNDAAFNDHAVQAVFKSGYKSFFTTLRGAHTSANRALVDNHSSILFRRQHFEPHWPVNHSLYFINR